MAKIIKYEDGSYRLTLSQEDAEALGVLLQNSDYEGDGDTPHVISGVFFTDFIAVVGGQPTWRFDTNDEGYISVYDKDEDDEDEDEDEDEDDEDE